MGLVILGIMLHENPFKGLLVISCIQKRGDNLCPADFLVWLTMKGLGMNNQRGFRVLPQSLHIVLRFVAVITNL